MIAGSSDWSLRATYPPLRSSFDPTAADTVVVGQMRYAARTTLLASALVAVTIAAGLAAPAAHGTTRYTTTVQAIVPGVSLRRIHDSYGPQEIRSLKVDPASPVTMDVALARSTFPGWARTSQMASAHGAVAAVNGDFGIENGRPLHPFAMDGSLVQTGTDAGEAFAISSNELNRYIGTPQEKVTLTTPSTSFPLTHWNSGVPAWSEISGYSAVGGSVERPPGNACSARLMPVGAPGWSTKLQSGIAQSFTVNQVLCASSPMPLNGGVVISSRNGGSAAPRIRNLVPGSTVKLSWSFGWPGVMDAVGGQPQLLSNGRVVAPTGCGYLCEKQPRTGVGVTADGKLLLVTVDGRQPRWSVGMTLVQFANEMKREGAVNALNLDGGGSTTMVVKGVKVNRPTDPSGERYVTSSLLVLPGKDAGEPTLVAKHTPLQQTYAPESAAPV
ncbi:MAG: phosphodiester glycosidase family protein, partial [Actinomycetota bacterium]|nr:phosphodiester glycosidase family protein [Actinomycetota bacterium]